MRAKKMLKHFHFATLFLVVYNALVFFAHSQSQSGFISLDCGLPENTTYTETSTEINYISDAAFVSGGESKSVLPEFSLNKQRQVTTLRSFPQGIRNCYTIHTRKGTKYLIRATFLYGNYDEKNTTPEFDIHLGTNFMDTVKFELTFMPVVKEVIHFPNQNFVRVCLANTGSGTPFINALELRPLKNTTYIAPPDFSLGLVVRTDLGSNTTTSYRYPNDVFDRLWVPYADPEWTRVATSETVDALVHIDSEPPNVVMNNAAAPLNASAPLWFNLETPNLNTGYYVHLHLAELQELGANESRSFDFKVNGQFWYGPITPKYLTSNTFYSSTPITGELTYNFTLEKRENSTLPPILNAVEIYALIDVSGKETEEDDVDAITNIKSIYGVERNWDGDPCLPLKYLWTGLRCSFNIFNASRITTLNLSSSGLTGEISTYIGNLDMLESLDLSNNNLTGSVPDFLSQLPNLKVLNLAKNSLTGLVPAGLVERSNQDTLSLNIEENQGLCASSPCNKKKKKKVVVPIAASVGGLFVALIMIAAIFLGRTKKRRQVVLGKTRSNHQIESFENKKRQFSYPEIVKITKNFSRVLGKGGFATVYHGVLGDGTEVAVKKIRIQQSKGSSQVQSQNASRGNRDEAEEQYKQFQAEVKLLLTVYHGNLTRLVGYCNQGIERVLIYEYMANGDLESYLSGKQSKVLNWETRLQIAIDSAQGLEYLHSGCKPPIIHRDIKTANILITKNFVAKLADFGLSKFFLTDDGTHVSTMHIAGTPGYLDPDLANNGLLNEKSDVYSFGVVLLQLITSRPTISKSNQSQWSHLSDWVRLLADNGNIKHLVDEKLRGDFEINSVWKAVEIAMACVCITSIDRPNMTKVVIELRECLALEKARKSNYSSSSRDSSREIASVVMSTELRPRAR